MWSRTPFLVSLSALAFIFTYCSGSHQSAPNDEAMLLEFSISELPEAKFSIDQSTGIIEIINFNGDEFSFDNASLTAEFTTSEGASVKVQDTIQESGVTSNSFERGIFYTVVSEDESSQTEYFVHLEESLPVSYYLTEEANLTLNPSGIAPLTAVIELSSRQNVTASLAINGNIPVNKTFDFIDEAALPVLGLYPDAENQVELTLTGTDGLSATQIFHIQTEPVPDFFPEIEINIKNESAMEPGMHFSELSIGDNGVFKTFPVIFDTDGNIRWYLDLSFFDKIVWSFKFNGDQTLFAAVGPTVYEWDMLGNVIKEINGPQDVIMHHEVIRIPNGNYIVAVDKPGNPFIDDDGVERNSVEDHILELDSSTGETLTEWDMGDILDVDRIDLTDPNNGDWFHMNAIWYDESDHSLIVSGRNQGLVKVNWDNELQWILAPHKGWGKAGRFGEGPETAPYLLTAVDALGTSLSEDIQNGTTESSEFSWTWGQHAPMLLPNGNLMVFDNGFNRNFGAASNNYSMATEYEIDEENMTIKQVWSYGKERGSEAFSNIISDVDYLPETGNLIFAPGFITGAQNSSKIIELAYPEKQVVFESTLLFKNQLASGSGWGNIDISYRAERVSLYGDTETATESAGKILSQW